MRGKLTIGTVWNPIPTAINIYIGRSAKNPSVLGNPYVITGSCSRDEACDKYDVYLAEQIKKGNKPIRKELTRMAKLILAGQDVNLLCFCTHKGLRCHGESVRKVVMEAVDKQLAK